jgi:hypothetical protein
MFSAAAPSWRKNVRNGWPSLPIGGTSRMEWRFREPFQRGEAYHEGREVQCEELDFRRRSTG